jgi:hypothetical protein
LGIRSPGFIVVYTPASGGAMITRRVTDELEVDAFWCKDRVVCQIYLGGKPYGVPFTDLLRGFSLAQSMAARTISGNLISPLCLAIRDAMGSVVPVVLTLPWYSRFVDRLPLRSRHKLLLHTLFTLWASALRARPTPTPN